MSFTTKLRPQLDDEICLIQIYVDELGICESEGNSSGLKTGEGNGAKRHRSAHQKQKKFVSLEMVGFEPAIHNLNGPHMAPEMVKTRTIGKWSTPKETASRFLDRYQRRTCFTCLLVSFTTKLHPQFYWRGIAYSSLYAI